MGFRRLLQRLVRRAKQTRSFDIMPYILPRGPQPLKPTDTSRPPVQSPPKAPTTDNTIFSPGGIALILSNLRDKFAHYEDPNTFPKIDLNFGNNRERFLKGRDLKRYLQEEDSREEIRNIIEGFNSFSFKRQAKPKNLELGETEELFGRVFEGSEREGWARIPGAWWRERKHVCAMDDRGRTFSEQMEKQVEDIKKAVEIWCQGADASLNIMKRKMFSAGVRILSLGGEVRTNSEAPKVQ
jgi:hypothetical protein